MLEGKDGATLSINQKLAVLKAITDLNGLALPKAGSIESLKCMSRKQLQQFIDQHQAGMIDITPNQALTLPPADPTPGGGAAAESENCLNTPHENFKIPSIPYITEETTPAVNPPSHSEDEIINSKTKIRPELLIGDDFGLGELGDL